MENQQAVIFYGAGEFAKILFASARIATPMPPVEHAVCFADASAAKHGTMYLGLPVMSLQDALSKYPDALIYIALGKKKRRELLSTFDEDILRKIIKREFNTTLKSCVHLDNELVIMDKALHFCCYNYFQNIPPEVKFIGDYEKLADDFIELRQGIISGLKDPNADTPCDDCIALKESQQVDDVDYKISSINDSENGICNFNCLYCNESLRHSDANLDEHIDIFKLLEVFRKRNMLSKDLHFQLARGELTVLPNKDRYYHEFENFYTRVSTNASVYDKQLHRKLQNGTAELIVSIDAGTRETFHQIRGVDCFDKVIDNLKKYNLQRKGALCIKYIICPGANDSTDDAVGFAHLCNEISPNSVAIVANLNAKSEDFDNLQTISCMKTMLEQFDNNHFHVKVQSAILLDLIQP